MNNLQKIASDLSGYGYEETSAQDDGYFNQVSADEKIAYVIEYSNSIDGIDPIGREEAARIVEFIDGGYFRYDPYYAFKALEN